MEEPQRTTIEVVGELNDVSIARAVLDKMVEELRKAGASRELSLAITKLQEARLWLGEHLRVS